MASEKEAGSTEGDGVMWQMGIEETVSYRAQNEKTGFVKSA